MPEYKPDVTQMASCRNGISIEQREIQLKTNNSNAFTNFQQQKLHSFQNHQISKEQIEDSTGICSAPSLALNKGQVQLKTNKCNAFTNFQHQKLHSFRDQNNILKIFLKFDFLIKCVVKRV